MSALDEYFKENNRGSRAASSAPVSGGKPASHVSDYFAKNGGYAVQSTLYADAVKNNSVSSTPYADAAAQMNRGGGNLYSSVAKAAANKARQTAAGNVLSGTPYADAAAQMKQGGANNSFLHGVAGLAEKAWAGAREGLRTGMNEMGYRAQAAAPLNAADDAYYKAMWEQTTGRKTGVEIPKDTRTQEQRNLDEYMGVGDLYSDAARAMQRATEKGYERLDKEGVKTTFKREGTYQEKADQKYADLGPKWQQAMGIAGSVGNQMIPILGRIAGTAIGGPQAGEAAQSILFFNQASGAAIEEALNDGADWDKALTYGTVIGGIEAATEAAGDAAGKMLFKAAGKALPKEEFTRALIGTLTNNKAMRTTLTILGQMNGEGLEEVASDLVSPFAKSIYNGHTPGQNWMDEVTLQGLWESYLGGAISGGILSGLGGAVNNQFRAQNQLYADATVNTALQEARASARENGFFNSQTREKIIDAGLEMQNIESSQRTAAAEAQKHMQLVSEAQKALRGDAGARERLLQMLETNYTAGAQNAAEGESGARRATIPPSAQGADTSLYTREAESGKQNDVKGELTNGQSAYQGRENGAYDLRTGGEGLRAEEGEGNVAGGQGEIRQGVGEYAQADIRQVTPAQLGIRNGGNEAVTLVDAQKLGGKAKSAADFITANGREAVAVRGAIQVGSGYADAYVENGRVYFRVDATDAAGNPISPKKLAQHELFHEYVNDEVLDRAADFIRESMTAEEFDAMKESYRTAYASIYDLESMSEAEIERLLREEIAADAYAGMNWFSKGTAVQEAIRAETEQNAPAQRAEAQQDSTGPPRFSLNTYSEQQKANWSQSRKILVYENAEQLKNFVEKARADSGYVSKIYFGTVDGALAAEIMNETGYDLRGKNVTLRADNVRKIFKDHGQERTEAPRGQRPVTVEDFAKIPDVIGSPDSITEGDYFGKQAVEFKKVIDGSRITVFAVDSGGSSLDLYVQTMYAGKKKGSIADTANASALTQTPETPAGTASFDPNIRSSTADSQEKSSGRAAVAGINARTADREALRRAEALEKSGADNESIRQETGWYRGRDGKWRFEIDDSGMEFRRDGDAQLMKEEGYRRLNELTDRWAKSFESGTELSEAETREMERLQDEYKDAVWEEKFLLRDFVKHDALFDAYPALNRVSLVFDTLPDGVKGYFSKRDNTIVLSDSLFGKEADTVLHEIQHVIQKTEGFTGGTSPAYWNRGENYDRAVEKYRDNRLRTLRGLSAEEQALYEEYRSIDREMSAAFNGETLYDESRMDALEKRSDELYKELYGKEWFGKLNRYDRILGDAEAATKDFYYNTAGEIEARDTANRRKLTAEERRKTPPDLGDADTVFADGSNISAYMDVDADGNPVTVVQADKNVFDNANRSQYAAIAQKIIKSKYAGQTLPLGESDLARIAKKSAGEYAFPRNRLSTNSREYDAKMRAAAELHNLLENSTYDHWAPDTKNHKEATLGFDYYKTVFAVNGKVFEGLVNVANSENGRVFYDITKIREVPDTYGKYVALLARSSSVFGNLSASNIRSTEGNSQEKSSGRASTQVESREYAELRREYERRTYEAAKEETKQKEAARIKEEPAETRRIEETEKLREAQKDGSPFEARENDTTATTILRTQSTSMGASTIFQQLISKGWARVKAQVTTTSPKIAEWEIQMDTNGVQYWADISLDGKKIKRIIEMNKNDAAQKAAEYVDEEANKAFTDANAERAARQEAEEQAEHDAKVAELLGEPDPVDIIFPSESKVADEPTAAEKAESRVAENVEKKTSAFLESASEIWHGALRMLENAGDTVSRMSKATGNKSLEGYYFNAGAYSQRAGNWIAPGGARTDIDGRKLGKSLEDMLAPMRKDPEVYRQFNLYALHLHNIDRMKYDNTAELETIKKHLDAIENAFPALRNQPGYVEQMAGNDEKTKLTSEHAEMILAEMAEGNPPNVSSLAEAAQLLLYARRKQARIQGQGMKPVFGYDVTAYDSQREVKRLEAEHPEFKEWMKEVKKYSDDLLDYRVQAGLDTRESVEAMKKRYPNYVPTLRVEGTNGKAARRARRNGGITVSDAIGRAVGSDAVLLPLHTALSRKTVAVMRNAGMNMLGREFLKEWDGKNKAKVSDYITNVREYENSTTDQQYTDDYLYKPVKDNVFSVYDGGKLYEITMDEGMTVAMRAFEPDKFGGYAVAKGLKKLNDLFKALCTGYNPFFTARNAVRDWMDAGFYSTDTKTWEKMYWSALNQIRTNGEIWQQYKALGGSYASLLDYTTGMTRQPKNAAARVVAKFEAISQAVEAAPRLAEFMTILANKGGSKTVNGVKTGEFTTSDYMEAMLGAADITTNFARGGTVAKALNKYAVPFLNPSIQGFSKFVRNAIETKSVKAAGSLILKAALAGILPTLLGELMYGDDEEWADIPPASKANYYLIKLGNGYWLKIPQGRAVAVLSTAGVYGMEKIKGNEVTFSDVFDVVKSNIAPTDIFNQNLATAWSQTKLRNPDNPGTTWYGGNIENERMQSLRPEDRYDENTDALSKLLGKTFHLSPKKINYLLDQYTGVIGDLLLPMLKPAAKAPLRILEPVYSAFTIDTTNTNVTTGQYYDLLDELKYDANDGDTAADVTRRYANHAGAEISDYYSQIREIQNDKNLNAQEKNELVRALKKQLIEREKEIISDAERYREAVENYMTANPELATDNAAAVAEFAEKYEITEDQAEDRMDAIVYREANREVFGAEYALRTYNSDVYDKARAAYAKGVSYDTYYDYYFATKDMHADKDENGKSISGSKKAKVVEYINSLDIPPEQKDALYIAAGYTEKSAKYQKWNGGSGGSGHGRRAAKLKAPAAPKAAKISVPEVSAPKVSAKVSDIAKAADVGKLREAAKKTARTAIKAGNRTIYIEDGSPLDYFLKTGKLPSTK